MDITATPLWAVTFKNHEEGEDLEDPFYQTTFERLKLMYCQQAKDGKFPQITTAHHAVFDNEEEARKESLRRLKNYVTALNRKIEELEQEEILEAGGL